MSQTLSLEPSLKEMMKQKTKKRAISIDSNTVSAIFFDVMISSHFRHYTQADFPLAPANSSRDFP